MLYTFIALVAISVSCGHCQLHSVCHSNALQMTEAQVIQWWALIMDRNLDGNVTTAELMLGFRDVIGGELPLSDATIMDMSDMALLNLGNLFGFSYPKDKFVLAWHDYFHDSIEFVEAVFDTFDTNRDAILQMSEVENILVIMKRFADANFDNVIQVPEFIHFFTFIYNC